MDAFVLQISQLTGSYIPRLVGAVVIVLVGWIVASVVSGVLRRMLKGINFNSRISRWISTDEKNVEADGLIARGVFFLIMLFVLVAAFQALGITLITEPINKLLNEIFAYAPKLIGALVLAVIAWVVAMAVKMVLVKFLGSARLDERIGGQAGVEGEPMPLAKTLSEAAFWLILLLFLPAILGTLGLEGLLAPVQGMLNKLLGFIPNILTAVIIALIGWLVAKIVQRIAASFFEAVGTDRLSERVGLATALGKQRLSGVLGTVLFVLILVPILIAALNALQLDAITQPASKMLEMLLLALPNIFAAVIILAISYVIGKVVAGLVSNLLEGMGFNTILPKLGICSEAAAGERSLSTFAGQLVLVVIMLFAAVEAAGRLGFSILSELVSQFMVLAGHILLGLVIFAIGLYLAELAAKLIRSSSALQASFLAGAARIAILVLAGAMSLRQMGLANEIINLAFGMTLGAIAVAVAIAFGVGGRTVAGRELETWVQSLKSDKPK